MSPPPAVESRAARAAAAAHAGHGPPHHGTFVAEDVYVGVGDDDATLNDAYRHDMAYLLVTGQMIDGVVYLVAFNPPIGTDSGERLWPTTDNDFRETR